MAEKPPTAVLSDQLKSVIAGRQLRAAVFLTFQFEPEFFEQQVLPLFFDVSLSHAEAIKRVQMEDLIREVPQGVAVYYDQNGLVADAKPARLDVRRIAVRHATGIFHPKNVFALVESDPGEDGQPAQTLIVASMSANLTRAGWWENVEVCHIEELREGELTRLRNDLLGFLDSLERRVFEKASDGHAALKAIKAFLRSTTQRQVRSSGGRLEPHFFDGSTSVVDFLDAAAGSDLRDLNLEIISPYFDVGPTSMPLSDLIKHYSPREVRVFLPKNEAGDALCSKEIFEWVKAQAGVSWAHPPKDLTRGGKSENARARMVHAKVYRFFSAQPKREFLFVGSVNLTGPGHRRGGNLETGFLVELDPPRRPDWWMECDGTKPTIYEPRGEDEGAVSNSGSRLSLRYWWDSKRAEAYWDDSSRSHALSVSWNAGALFDIDRLGSRQWTDLPAIAAAALEQVLRSTSILLVSGDRADGVPVLVQEEGMKSKPSALFDLSPSEILRYWSLLTAEQRAAFIVVVAPEAAIGGDANLVTKYTRLVEKDTFFDRFAGIFISFGNLERHIRESLKAGNARPAEYRLFGQKYDSLERVRDVMAKMDARGYSQVPVIRNGEVLGVFSYRSFARATGGATLDRFNKDRSAPGDLPVDEFIEQFEFARVTEELPRVFDAMDRDNGILVGTPENLIGILTPMDFLRYLYSVAGPFVLVSEIELAVRALIKHILNPDQITISAKRLLASAYSNAEKIPTVLEEMTFDNYRMLVTHGDTWPGFEPLLGGTPNRVSGKLMQVGAIRNDLFHFKRRISLEDHQTLALHRNWFLNKIKQAGLHRDEGEGR